MADPLLILGATAAALQIASQAIELVKSVGEFYGRIKDAPRLTRARIMHLEQLINISKLIAKTPSLQTAEVQDVLVVCLLTVLKLRELLEKHSVEKLGRIEKTMNAVKLGKKEDAIMVLLATIEREKSLLALSIHQIDAYAYHNFTFN
jgi:hypothetical protein